MSPLNALILGLGLFFLGLRLVSDNLKSLAGGRLRNGIVRTTRRPVLRAGVGIAAGAMLQSATAVTFICVSMVAAGFLNASAAAGVIIWSNVGLTALAFVATLNIHPAVALVVGAAGIVLGLVRVRSWQTVAGAVLGVGLILLGLQQMGEGAAPLKNAAPFHAIMNLVLAAPPLAFLVGILVAAVLQSNTGATMMVITLAAAGALRFDEAALLIYGTNLGAIALRYVLSLGMKGIGARLVRLEDFFCVLSGVVMLALFYIEKAGVPLVLALSKGLAPSEASALAVVFLLSNVIPALILSPMLSHCVLCLCELFSVDVAVGDGEPAFLSPQALGHPASALDLLRRELARLLRMTIHAAAPPIVQEESEPPHDFSSLSKSVEDFAVKLAVSGRISEEETRTLHRLRAVLSGIRHLEEAERFYTYRAGAPGALTPDQKQRLDGVLDGLVADAAAALDAMDCPALGRIRNQSKKHGPFLCSLLAEVFPDNLALTSLDRSAAIEDFRLTIWTFHRLMEITASLPAPPQCARGDGAQCGTTNARVL